MQTLQLRGSDVQQININEHLTCTDRKHIWRKSRKRRGKFKESTGGSVARAQ